jgi:HEAT repeat protein
MRGPGIPLRAAALAIALIGAGGIPSARGEEPKPAAEDLRALPDDKKAARLDEIRKRYEDIRRNQDLKPVRERRNLVGVAGELRYPPAAKFLRNVFDDESNLSNVVAALLAIGKSGDFDTIEYATKRAIQNARKEPVLVASLARTFANVEEPKAREWIVTRLAGIDDSETLACVVEAVGEARVESAVDPLSEVLEKSIDAAVRFEALRAIGKCGGKRAPIKLIPWLADRDWRLRMAAAEGLGFSGQADVIADLRNLVVRSEEPIVVETAIEAIARLGTREAFEPLVEGLKVGRLRARQKARAALRGLALTLFKHEKDYNVDPNAWTTYWNKVKRGVDPDDPSFGEKETASYFNFPIHTDRVLFILDVSGSMEWPDPPRGSGIKPGDWKERRIDVAHRELYKALRELAKQNRGRVPKKLKRGETSDLPWAPSEDGTEPPTLFRVATFSSGVVPWRKDAVLATEENVEEAIAWLEKQGPHGGTATYEALEYGVSLEDVDTVYFLSDGVPSLGRWVERETILARVRQMNRFRRVSISTIALIIGLSPIESLRKYEDPDDMAELMSRIASENQGKFANESKP